MARRSRLARRRKELRLTRQQVARKAGVTRKTVQRWESGASNPYPREHPDLARAYQWPLDQIDWLLARNDEVDDHDVWPAVTEGNDGGRSRRQRHQDGDPHAALSIYDRLTPTWSSSEPALVELRDALAA